MFVPGTHTLSASAAPEAAVTVKKAASEAKREILDEVCTSV